MKRPVLIIAAVLLSVTFACNKHQELPSPPERELSVPEKVEKELTDFLAKDWKSLADTLHYFDSTMEYIVSGHSEPLPCYIGQIMN